MPTSELITELRTVAQGLDFPVRFQILDACDRLERKSRDNELLIQKIVELRKRTVKTNADRIRAMSDKELAHFLADKYVKESCLRLKDQGYEPTATQIEYINNTLHCTWMKWLQLPSEDSK